MSPPPVPFWDTNSIHTVQFNFPKMFFNIILLFTPSSSGCFFSSSLQPKLCTHFLSPPRSKFSAIFILLDFILIFGKGYILWSSSVHTFLQVFFFLILTVMQYPGLPPNSVHKILPVANVRIWSSHLCGKGIGKIFNEHSMRLSCENVTVMWLYDCHVKMWLSYDWLSCDYVTHVTMWQSCDYVTVVWLCDCHVPSFDISVLKEKEFLCLSTTYRVLKLN